jgi:hypothetical protein
MDENGFYEEWIDYLVIITPSLAFDLNITIRGKFGKRQDIKEYLKEIYHEALTAEIDVI